MARLKAVFSSPAFQYPVIAMIILIAASAWYYRFALGRSETALNERSLHVLSALAGEFSSRLEAYESIARQDWARDKLRSQVPELQDEDCGLNKGQDPQDKPQEKLRVFDHTLHIVVGGQPRKTTRSCWTVSFENMIGSLQDSVPNGTFDDLLLADAKGRILYQTRRSGMEIADLHPFFAETGQKTNKPVAKPRDDGKTKRTTDTTAQKKSDAEKQEPGEKAEDLATLLATSKSTDVNLGGEPYKLYTVPVSGPALIDDSEPLSFVVGGILREHAFQAERVKPLQNTLVTLGFIVLLVGAGAYPILRFRLMGPAQVLKQRIGFVLALQVFFASVFLGGLAGHLIFSQHTHETDDELARLADSIEKNLGDETHAVLTMLDNLEIFYLKSHPTGLVANKVQEKTCSDKIDFTAPQGDSWKFDILHDINDPEIYPYFDHAYFADGAGYQEIKFSARSSVTPEVRLCTSKTFSHVRGETDLWHNPNYKDPGFWIEPDYSRTSGRYLAFISRPSSGPLRPKAPVAGIGTELISLSQAVLPPEYGFAIVDHEGKVLFHSTPSKNGRENFADASAESQRLRDLFETRETGIVEAPYLGIRHRTLVRPIRVFSGCPWSIVVFRDLTAAAEDHFDAVLMFTFLVVTYVILVIVAGWLVGCAKRPPSWIWPTERNRPVYWRLFWVLVLAFIFNCVLFMNCDGTQLWVTAFTVPFAAVIFTVWRLKYKGPAPIITVASAALWLITAIWTWFHQSSPVFWLAFTGVCAAFACLALPLGWLDTGLGGFRKAAEGRHGGRRLTRPSVATVYALPATALLFTVGFIPALRLFNASVLFQNVVAARRSQLQLAYQFEQRKERITQDYEGRYGDEKSVRVPFLCKRLSDTKDLYYLNSDRESKHSDREPKQELRPHLLEPLLLAISSNLLNGIDSDGSSPRHRIGMSSPKAAKVWCEQGQFPDKKLLLYIGEQSTGCEKLKADLAGDYQNRWIVSKLPSKVDPKLEAGTGPLALFETLLMLAMVIASFFALRDAITRLFVLDWRRPKPWHTVKLSPTLDLRDEPFERLTVLLGAPGSGKSEALRRKSGVHYIDLAKDSERNAELPVLRADAVVVLDHFEHHLEHLFQSPGVLRTLEQFVYDAKCRVIIVTAVDPLYYFHQLDRNGDVERWIKVLAGFQVVRVTNGESIKGEQYYELLLRTCSTEERMALHQIAKHAWSNYQQKPALAHLVLRGMVTHDSRFEIADADFAEYLQRSVSEAAFAIPETSGTEDSLGALRIVMIAVGVAFVAALAYLWGEQTVAYVTTGASVLTAASRAFAKSKGRGSIGAEGLESA
jgi:hypothetical protein